MPGLGSCLRSAKWACDRPEGGYHRPLLDPRSLCLHTGLVRTTIGSLLQPPVAEIKEWTHAFVFIFLGLGSHAREALLLVNRGPR